jgi:hypothetical protein
MFMAHQKKPLFQRILSRNYGIDYDETYITITLYVYNVNVIKIRIWQGPLLVWARKRPKENLRSVLTVLYCSILQRIG